MSALNLAYADPPYIGRQRARDWCNANEPSEDAVASLILSERDKAAREERERCASVVNDKAEATAGIVRHAMTHYKGPLHMKIAREINVMLASAIRQEPRP